MTEIYPSNRRDAIVRLTGTLAAMALLAKVRPAAAASDASVEAAAPSGGSADLATDDTTLTALLQVELNAIEAYTVGAGILAAAEAAGAPDAGGDPNAAIAPVVLAAAVHFRAQHMMHRDALSARITATNGLPIASSTFVPPAGFKPSVLNVMKLACNAERAAAVAYAQAQKGLSAAASSRLAAAIVGTETQHFVVLNALIEGLIAGNAMTLPSATSIVPQAFVASVGPGTTGLESVAPFTYS